MATMTTLMSSPHLASAPHPLPHSPLNLSPGASPALRPVKSTFKPTPPPLASSQSTPLGVSPSLSPRSYARAPTQRPYSYSPLMSRGTKQSAKELEGDPKMFAELVAGVVVSRDKKAKASNGNRSLPGSWDQERAELLVDVPVWSPGCFQDLSTLHALRDRTLQHVHALLSHLISTHSIPASYSLLARSALASPAAHQKGPCKKNACGGGWGCIRLAPSPVASGIGKIELRPKVRRASMDYSDQVGTSPTRKRFGKHSSHDSITGRPLETPPDVGESGETILLETDDSVVVELDLDQEEDEVRLKSGYTSEAVSDDEEEDADEVVMREIEKRGAKEGTVFLMTLFGSPALILV